MGEAVDHKKETLILMNNEQSLTKLQERETRTQRDWDTIRLLEWIQEYSGLWRLICTPNAPEMTYNMMKRVIQQLADEQFYEIIFVLLTVHRSQHSMTIALKELFVKMISAGWKGETYNKERFFRDIADLLT